MCTNYKPSSREIFTQKFEDIRETKISFKPEVFPNDFVPIYRQNRSDHATTAKIERLPARFGLVPSWAKDDHVTKFGRMANNARTETVRIQRGQRDLFFAPRITRDAPRLPRD